MLPHFELWGVHVFSYPLILGIVWGLSFEFSKILMRNYQIQIPYFTRFFIGLFISVWVGAKLLYLITLSSEQATAVSFNQNFWLGGGFVFYGGAILGIAWILFYCRIFQLPVRTFRFAIPVLCLSHAVGRLACFMAGCCYGKPSEHLWAIKLHGVHRHPTQLYEASLLFILFFYLMRRFRQEKSVIFPYFLLYGMARFALEFLRGDSIRGINIFGFLSTSQFISLFMMGIGIWLMLRQAKRV